MNRLRTIALCSAITAAPFLIAGAVIDPAGAQTTPPTVPCDGCGPSGTKNPGANQAWAYPQHHCLPDGTSAYSLNFGLGKNATGPANFYVRFTNGPIPDKPLGQLNPGTQKTVYPIVVVAAGQTINIEVFAYSAAGGVPVQFGNGSTLREFVLTCPCDQPPTTTVTISPPSSSTPSAPATTPGTTPLPPVSVPGTPSTTVPFELPATGGGEWLALGGALLVFFGGSALLLGRKQTHG